ncbi:hypothetical protein Gohar_004641 [Gossypium harknessii]|uniref:Uncharacterized protein n=1 Tax=Gossypium harknessii TaxID=34285 RepID=A0A7J9H5L2_9ROSI|nr:hypothetical protein [Gossypium harknessii]
MPQGSFHGLFDSYLQLKDAKRLGRVLIEGQNASTSTGTAAIAGAGHLQIGWFRHHLRCGVYVVVTCWTGDFSTIMMVEGTNTSDLGDWQWCDQEPRFVLQWMRCSVRTGRR